MRAVMTRALVLLPTSLVLFLLLAPVALATQESVSGEGTYGPADDKVVTNAGFILIIFFPVFIFVMSIIQWQLEKRKYRRMAAKKAAADAPGGW